MLSPNQFGRHSSTSLGRHSAAAIRRGDLKISDPIPFSPKHSEDSHHQSDHNEQRPHADGAWPRRSRPPSVATPDAGGDRGLLVPTTENRESTGPSILRSTMSSAPSKTSLKRRKSGGFRATIRSLFGSKRHRSSLGDGRSYQLSDPGNLVAISEKPANRRVPRTPTQPITIVTQASPLGSHSPFEPLEVPKVTKYEGGETTLPRHLRRNTLPSVVFSDEEAETIRAAVELSSKRYSVERSAIGTTMPQHRPGQMSKTLKRRSRSADALTELANTQIKTPTNWRQSLIEEPIRTYRSTTRNENTRATTAGTSPQLSGLNSSVSSNSLRPVQTFDFGLLADVNSSVTIQDRLATVELKMIDLEYAIARLQGHDLTMPVCHNARPSKRRSIHGLFAETNAPPSSRSTSGQGLTFLSSSADSSTASGNDEGLLNAQRSSTTATIRPSTAIQRSPRPSKTPSPSSNHKNKDQFDSLIASIHQEQVARKLLEAQVLELQRQIAYANAQTTHYATPSPESIHEHPMAIRARPLHRTPAFPRRSKLATPETSRFSVSDTEDTDNDTDDGFHDVDESPQQRVKSAFGSPSINQAVEIF